MTTLKNVGQKPIKYAVEDILVIEDEKIIPTELREVVGRLTAGSQKDIWIEPRLTLLQGRPEYYIDMHMNVRYGLEEGPYTQLLRNRRLCRIQNGIGMQSVA